MIIFDKIVAGVLSGVSPDEKETLLKAIWRFHQWKMGPNKGYVGVSPAEKGP